jgi:hypothetical protein
MREKANEYGIRILNFRDMLNVVFQMLQLSTKSEQTINGAIAPYRKTTSRLNGRLRRERRAFASQMRDCE